MNKPFYIFLDFDGVIITQCQMFLRYYFGLRNEDVIGRNQYDINCVERLKSFISTHPDTHIVLSTSHRIDYDGCVNELKSFGITNVVGRTPRSRHESVRGDEIFQYMKENNISEDDICIIDDDSDMENEETGVDLMHRFVHTNWEVGLQPEHVEQMRKMYEDRKYYPEEQSPGKCQQLKGSLDLDIELCKKCKYRNKLIDIHLKGEK